MKEESTPVEPQKADTVGDKGSPWEMFKRASPVQEVAEVSSTKAKNPWDMFRESRVGFIAEKAAKKVQKAHKDIGFERVFSGLIQAESGGRHYDESGGLITSPVGARGITQIMPETAKAPGYGVTPLRDDSEEEYLRFGRDYLQAMVNRFDGDYRKAIASYNAGAGNVDKAVREANRKGGDWVDYLPKKSETIPYMDKVLGTSGGRYGTEIMD